MARPGEVVPIRAGADAPHGESADLARLAVPRQGAGPANPSQGQGPPVPNQQAPIPGGALPGGQPDLNGGFDAALLSPTTRPQEPLTHGASFGPGSNFVQAPSEDDRTFQLRVADTLSTDPKLAPFVEALRTGR